MKRSGLMLAALGLVLSSCTVTVDEGNPPPRPRPPRPDQFCARIYQPVCAMRFGERRTFPNSCEADVRGFDVLYGGECEGRPPRPPRPEPSGGVICPMIHAPVCAISGGIERTFSNACIAEGSGFRVIDNGPC